MLNAAMIGLGWWGQKLVRAAEGSDLIRFTRAVTLEPDLAREFCATRKLKLGASYDDVLADRGIDAVVLATPHTTHRRLVEAAAGARKHVFCEKPFAMSKADAQAALSACRRAGVDPTSPRSGSFPFAVQHFAGRPAWSPNPTNTAAAEA